MDAIRLTGVTKIYPRKGKDPIRAVDGLDLIVPAGGIFGILGPNGAGKTTIIKMICGLIQPHEGQVAVWGHDLRRHRRQAMGFIGAVLEGTRNIYWRLSAWENLMYFARLKGRLGRDVAGRAQALLTELDLWSRRHDPVRTFSRGMQQKVAIACALIADPEIVLLDEPTLGLDVQSARTVREWVFRLSREEGKTVILTTHQLPVAQELCDQIAIMREGRLIANEPIKKMLNLFEAEYYEIRLGGKMTPEVAAEIEHFKMRHENGQTVLTGYLHHEMDLYPLLDRFREAGLPLISAARNESDLEGIFIKLMEQDG